MLYKLFKRLNECTVYPMSPDFQTSLVLWKFSSQLLCKYEDELGTRKLSFIRLRLSRIIFKHSVHTAQ